MHKNVSQDEAFKKWIQQLQPKFNRHMVAKYVDTLTPPSHHWVTIGFSAVNQPRPIGLGGWATTTTTTTT